jgi:hypothetical protein
MKMNKMMKAQLLKKAEKSEANRLNAIKMMKKATVTKPNTAKAQAQLIPNLLAKLQQAVAATPDKELTITAFQAQARNVSLVRIQQQLRRLLFDLAIDLQVVGYKNADVDGLAATLDAIVYGEQH